MALHQSGEDYLEAILALREERGVVRSIDVAQHLGYSKPSISRAMSILKASGYLVMEKDGHLKLTEEGERVARSIYERHQFLTDWLIELGVSEAVAVADACKIEHHLSDETFEKVKAFVEIITAVSNVLQHTLSCIMVELP